MAPKRKYPKAFYDDGLGDILEWIDDEVLVHSEDKLGGKRESKNNPTKENASRKKKKTEPVKLYGDNDTTITRKQGEPKQVRFDFNNEENQVNLDKKLQLRVRGLINRLAAQTMAFVTAEFEKIYSTNERTLINSILFNTIETAIICKQSLAKRKLVAELMLLVSYLNFKINHDIGAFIVHRLIREFDSLIRDSNDDEGKRLNNIMGCLLNLYITGLISSNIIFGITKQICSKNFRPKSVELLLITVKSVGFQLRKDGPAQMRQFIIDTQDNIKLLKSKSNLDSKVEFMMEALCAIKNNNMSKLVNYGCDIDRDTIESTLKSLIKRTKLPESLNDATYDEILNSSNWYLLETRFDNKQTDIKKTLEVGSNKSSTIEIKISKALGLNKPAELTIFSSLLRVSDCVEAINVIIGFGMNHCSDAMLVCLQVAIHEKSYNPFYFNVISGLCKFHRKYKIATKFSIQDKIRVLGNLKPERVEIFKKLALELIKSDAVPITILKAVEWADLGESTKDFLTYILKGISELSDEEKRKMMVKVDKKSIFAGAMRSFTNCFLKGCKLFR